MSNHEQPPAWIPELVKMLRAETQDIRRVGGELVDVLRDLRDELAHLRTAREREERADRVIRDLRPARMRRQTG